MIYVAVQAFRRQQATPQKEADLYTNERALAALREQARSGRRRIDDAGRTGGRRRRHAPASSARGSITDDGDVPPPDDDSRTRDDAPAASAASRDQPEERRGLRRRQQRRHDLHLVPKFFGCSGRLPRRRRSDRLEQLRHLVGEHRVQLLVGDDHRVVPGIEVEPARLAAASRSDRRPCSGGGTSPSSSRLHTAT